MNSETSAAPPTESPRILEVDVLRGLAMLGVVFSHALDGLVNGGLVSHDSSLVWVNTWLYQFRMPAIALVMGLFVGGGIRKYGPRGYVHRRAVFAAYLYVIWYVIEMLAELAGNSVKNHPITWQEAVAFWVPPAHLWFMPYLAVAATILTLCWVTSLPRWVWLAMIVVLSAVTWGYWPNLIGLRGLSLLGFTAVGAVLGREGFGNLILPHRRLAMVLGAGCLVWSAWLASQYPMVPATAHVSSTVVQQTPWWQWTGTSILVAALGVIGLTGLAVLLSQVPFIKQGLIYLGGKTLEVYLAHVIIVATARIALVRLGITDATALTIALTAIGVVVPLLIERVVRGTPLHAIFSPPTRLLPQPLSARPSGTGDSSH